MIPARKGSTRLKLKNLALINNKPLVSYAINAAKKSGVFTNIVLNADDHIFKNIADRYEIDFYLREKQLGSSNAKSDEVVDDFISNHLEVDILVWVNSIAPLMQASHIQETLEYFIKNDLDSLITSEKKNVHANFLNEPINYITEELFAQTQDLIPIELFNYCLMIWRVDSFKQSFNNNGHGLFCGKFSTYTLEDIDIIIKTAQDLQLAEQIVLSRQNDIPEIIYDSMTNKILYDEENEAY